MHRSRSSYLPIFPLCLQKEKFQQVINRIVIRVTYHIQVVVSITAGDIKKTKQNAQKKPPPPGSTSLHYSTSPSFPRFLMHELSRNERDPIGSQLTTNSPMASMLLSSGATGAAPDSRGLLCDFSESLITPLSHFQ